METGSPALSACPARLSPRPRATGKATLPDAMPSSLDKELGVLRPSSPAQLSVSAKYDDADWFDCDETLGGRRTIKAKGGFAPVTKAQRSHSPASLLWSEPGWHADSFTFAPQPAATTATNSPTPHASPVQEQQQQAETRSGANGEQTHAGDGAGSGALSAADIPTSSTSIPSSADAPPPPSPQSPVTTSPSRSKRLAPTAQPFAPKVKPLTPVAHRPHVPPLDINTSLGRYAFPAATAYNDQAGSVASSPVEPHTPASSSSRRHLSLSSDGSSGNSQFDYDGQLLSQGARYTIADEILQLQSAPLGGVGMHSDVLEVLDDDVAPVAGTTRMRAASEDSSFITGIEHWRQQQPFLGGRHQQPRFGSSAGLERSRSSSLAGPVTMAGSYLSSASLPRPAFERSQTAAQLQTYFGPSPNDSSPLHLPGGFDSYAPYSPTTPSSCASPRSRQASFASLAGSPAAYPPLAHPEPYNLTRDDPLYLEARDVFIESTCTSLDAPPTEEHLATMAQHFDRAMHQLHPLATLFGLSQDAANQLLADPANSGVSDVVLKVAAMMGRQQQMASVQRSAMGTILPGPSPNNRKTALYKTELCHSWVEINGCRYGIKCQFAHGVKELRETPRHPKFKSEICRTFWQEGACPYGKRCCFIHAMPDSTSSPIPSPRKGSAASSRAQSPRPKGRMTSTAVTGAPSRTFGPALSELLGTSSPGSSSLQTSPTKPEALGRSSSSSSLTSSIETSTLFGLGIRERPGQAPPTYKDAPQSRLQRLASLSSSSSSLASLAGRGSSSSLTSLAGYASSPTKPSAGAVTGTFSGAPHARHNSATSFMSSGSSGAAYSPLLTRSGSTSSLSSGAGSPVLHRVAGDWLAGPSYGGQGSKSSALEWPAIEELSLDDPPATPASALYGRA